MAALCGLAVSADAALVRYDLRAVPEGTTGAQVSDPKTVLTSGPAGNVRMQLWAMVENADANNVNDGFQQTHQSILSTGALRGALSAANMAPFSGLGAQVGKPVDLDADGDMDIGDNRTAEPDVASYFIASTGAMPLLWPDIPAASKMAEVAGGPFSSFLVGTVDFAFNGATGTNIASINLRPRVKSDGTETQRTLHVFIQDGASVQLSGDNAGVTVGAPVVVGIPEPSTIALVATGLLGLALLARRRS